MVDNVHRAATLDLRTKQGRSYSLWSIPRPVPVPRLWWKEVEGVALQHSSSLSTGPATQRARSNPKAKREDTQYSKS
ncbi:hypothetical protein COLO4_25536 [Corchorus olitorius]|uniref:Uncharacterized protein n=1 Tax=Corchorus olitorius TaxID=93759 RepID=A0A1R3I266_9ROSI|nr:hypothetical protein COLO4_25536 [Corchorus olitorius]